MKTDNDLIRALAKMLPEKLKVEKWQPLGGELYEYALYRIDRPFRAEIYANQLLQICWEIEEKLTYAESIKYEIELNKMIMLNANKHCKLATAVLFDWHASWQQRVTALAKVK